MFASLCILGRQPKLGLAELESLFGAPALQSAGDNAVLLDAQPATVPFAYLGGTIKFCKVLTLLETNEWAQIESFLLTAVPQHAAALPAGKLRLGMSVYNLKVLPKQLHATGLRLKKTVKSTGRSMRYIPNVEPALNSAQVLHNQLTSQLGWELIFVKYGRQTIVAQTIAVQDITSYTHRDRGRPKRDARVGMLSPKLAQIIINLAAGTTSPPFCENNDSRPARVPVRILDPFCGTGVILQEASLMGMSAYGTDLEPRMIDYAKTNLEWLAAEKLQLNIQATLTVADATKYSWDPPFDTIASEAYLGRPFTTQPDQKLLEQTSQEVNTIIKKFLENLASQVKPGFRLCLAVPAWHSMNGFRHLPTLDHLKELGYNRLSFVHVAAEDLIYYREGQFVGRELITLIRN